MSELFYCPNFLCYSSKFRFCFRFFNYRGRGGGYYNRNSVNPGGYRGNMNFNRGGGYRPRSYNRNYNSNSTGIPQQNNKPEQQEPKPAAAVAGKVIIF